MRELQEELAVAIGAVRAAANVCRRVQADLLSAAPMQKADRSPVTVADFASQALVCATLRERSKIAAIVGEEDAAELRESGAAAVRERVVAEVRAEGRAQASVDEVLGYIDLGGADPMGAASFWTLDPIDGTKGFLRGQQYAIALGLIRDGAVVLGALACPQLDAPDGSRGLLMTAIRGQGTFAAPLFSDGASTRVQVRAHQSDERFCESVDASHSDHAVSAKVAAQLGIVAEPLRLDSQAKYACVARGDAAIYLRLPTGRDYREKIWDHAAGLILVEEAGGRVSDVRGAPLDFSRGRQLENNLGVIATDGRRHDEVVAAVAAVAATLEGR